jgi:hypothetical protein
MRALGPALALAAALCAAPARAGDLVGRVTLGVEGAELAELGPTVVFLEPPAGEPAPPLPVRRVTIRQRNARFEPEFLVVAMGQTVEMPNDDTIFHNVFSLSRPNTFDLGLYPAGELRNVTFRHSGLVRLYCSIHESMRGAVLVTPGPWFATATAAGDWRIAGVPPGSYRLKVWNERLPEASRTVSVDGEATQRVDFALGGEGR